MANNRAKSDCKGDSIYPWSCSQILLKCTIMTQQLICEHMSRSGGVVSLNRMHHRNNHQLYEAEGSPLTWFNSSLICTCPILSWIAYSFWKMLWLPTAFTNCNCSCYFCCLFFHQKKKEKEKGLFYSIFPCQLTVQENRFWKQNSEALDQFDSWYNSCSVTITRVAMLLTTLFDRLHRIYRKDGLTSIFFIKSLKYFFFFLYCFR